MSEAVLWTPPVRPSYEAPAVPSDTHRARALRTAADPRVLSAEVLGLLLIAVAFRHPITTALGTAGTDVPPVIAASHTSTQTATKPQASRATTAPRAAAAPLHAPRDPFAPLEQAGSSSLAAAAAATAAQSTGVPTTSSTSTSTTTSPTTATAVTATGTGTTYRVLAGDSLWSIARQSIGPSATIATIDTTWHQIYDANRAAIGGNPSVLHVGIVLRVPSAR